jgi:hypothetical protein
MKNFNKAIENRTRDLPACRSAPTFISEIIFPCKGTLRGELGTGFQTAESLKAKIWYKYSVRYLVYGQRNCSYNPERSNSSEEITARTAKGLQQWHLRSSGMLRSVDRYLVTVVSGQIFTSPRFKDSAWPFEMWPINYTAAEPWYHDCIIIKPKLNISTNSNEQNFPS